MCCKRNYKSSLNINVDSSNYLDFIISRRIENYKYLLIESRLLYHKLKRAYLYTYFKFIVYKLSNTMI